MDGSKRILEATTEKITDFMLEQVICRHGCPKITQSDRDSIFISELFHQISLKLGTEHKVSTAYHPESQGLVEKKPFNTKYLYINVCIH